MDVARVYVLHLLYLLNHMITAEGIMKLIFRTCQLSTKPRYPTFGELDWNRIQTLNVKAI